MKKRNRIVAVTASCVAVMGLLIGLSATSARSQVASTGPTAYRGITARRVGLDASKERSVVTLRNLPAGSYFVSAKVRGYGGSLQCTLYGPSGNTQAWDAASANTNVSSGTASWTLPLTTTLTTSGAWNADVRCLGQAPNGSPSTSDASIVAVTIGSQQTTSADPS